jgi:Porin subfamily
MKVANRLLLGTAAGLMALSAAPAADMPLKAKPVQYVKICTLYGDGYYYIPGTDTCIRIGGYVREDLAWNAAGGRTPAYSGTQGAQDRTVSAFSSRVRATIAMDTRTQTTYGTLRTLTSLKFQNQNQSESFNVQRAFLQWAGFSFGRMQSFSDVFSLNESWNIEQQQTGSETGPDGVNAIAYTFDLGAGGSLNIGADERRTKSLTNLSVTSALKVGAEPTDFHQGETWPDAYINLRVDQDWGFAGLTGGIHNVNATYYGAAGTGPFAGANVCPQPLTTQCGHPDDKVGFFVMAGGELKLPMLGPGDRIGADVRYGQGASAYTGGSNLSSPDLFASGNNLAVGWMTDGVFVNGSAIELTTAWAVQGGYEHHWSQTFYSTILAGYANISYDAAAKSFFSGAVCAGGGATGVAAGQAAVSFAPAANNCNPNWSYLETGIRATWTPVDGLAFTTESLYTYIWSGFTGTGSILASAPGARPTGIYSFSNQGIWSQYFRVQRNFNTAEIN